MAIDPSISLAVQPPKFESPTNMLAQALAFTDPVSGHTYSDDGVTLTECPPMMTALGTAAPPATLRHAGGPRLTADETAAVARAVGVHLARKPRAARTPLATLRPRCPFQSDTPVTYCASCSGAKSEARHVYGCSHPDNPTETCTRGPNGGGTWSCLTCPHHPEAAP